MIKLLGFPNFTKMYQILQKLWSKLVGFRPMEQTRTTIWGLKAKEMKKTSKKT